MNTRRNYQINEIRKGHFVARISLGYLPNGNQRRIKVSGRSRAEVKREVEKLRSGQELGTFNGSNLTLSQYAETWKVTTLPIEDIRTGTRDDYLWQLDEYVLPSLGRLQLSKITPKRIERWQGELLTSGGKRSQGLSGNTVRLARNALSKVLTAAVVDGCISSNPVSSVKGPKKNAYKNRSLTSEEVTVLLNNSEGWLRNAIILGVRTGLRPGEVVALRWEDIRGSFLTVNHTSKSVKGNGVVLSPPKTNRSRRMVPLSPSLKEALSRWKEEQEQIGGSEFVISQTGNPIRRDSFSQSYKRLAMQSDSESTPHWLRHTFATALIQDGKPTAHVAELLGDTEAMVSTVYSHVIRPKVELADAIDDALPLDIA